MTQRSFDAADLVPLPVLDAAGAVALGHKLFTRAKREALTKPEGVALKRLRHAHTALREANRARLQEEPVVLVDRKEAYRSESAAFSAMYAWLSSWASLPPAIGGEKTQEAARISGALFGDGLRFLQLPHDACWVEADNRVRWLMEHDGEKVFTRLGGLEMLEHVRTAHAKLGSALGITTMEKTKTESAKIRAPLDAFCARLREYVVQLAAQASIGGDDAKQRAERLLVPLARWESRRVSRRADAEPTVPAPASPAPTPPVA